jgi:hypothetical protein
MAIATNNLVIRQEIKDSLIALLTALSNTPNSGYALP